MSATDDYLLSHSLGSLVPAEGDNVSATTSRLLSRWDDLSLRDLPAVVRDVALQGGATVDDVLQSLVSAEAVGHGARALVSGIRDAIALATVRQNPAIPNVCVARLGLESEHIPTLDELARAIGVSRELIRQWERHGVVAPSAVTPRSPIILSIDAWFAIHPRDVLDEAVITELARGSRAHGRCLKFALEALGYPRRRRAPLLWAENASTLRAANLALDELGLPSFVGLAGWPASTTHVRSAFPGIDASLDLNIALPRILAAQDFGPGLDDRIIANQATALKRAGKLIATYLARRATPAPPSAIAEAVRRAVPPFERLGRVTPTASGLYRCADASPGLLETSQNGTIALGPGASPRYPTGQMGLLYSIVARNGQPMRMGDLCDRAARYGIGRNTVGVQIHSGRAACLFMVARGIVGLVGRDEDADPGDYPATRPNGRSAYLVPGRDIAIDRGLIEGDIEVRRSIREQGLGLPWPFSLALLDDSSELRVDGEPIDKNLRANGDLDIPGLNPQQRVRLTLARDGGICRVYVSTLPGDPLTPWAPASAGTRFTGDMSIVEDQPPWVAEAIRQLVDHPGRSIDDVISLLPSQLALKRRRSATLGLAALGMIYWGGDGWHGDPDAPIPPVLMRAFRQAAADGSSYPYCPQEERAAMAWLVRAAWLTPNLGWSIVRPTDFTGFVDFDDVTGAAPVTTPPRETAQMMIAEAIDELLDTTGAARSKDEPTDRTATCARRVLIALGYTGYGAVQVQSIDGQPVVRYTSQTGGGSNGVWLLKPARMAIDAQDMDAARSLAASVDAPIAAVFNGVNLRVASESLGLTEVNLSRSVADDTTFDVCVSLAANPAELNPPGESDQ